MTHLETDLARMRDIYTAQRTDPVLNTRMEQSNEVSLADGQVAHGMEHALDVEALTLHIITRTEALFPGTFNEFYRLTALSSALTHDVGRSVAVKDHDKHGARITDEYLRDLAVRLYGSESELPEAFRARVVSNVRRHRSDSWLYKSEEEKARRLREIDGPDIAALLLADKLCGSEVRVQADKLALMRTLSRVKLRKGMRRKFELDAKWTLARINWGNPDQVTESPELIKACKILLHERGIRLPRGVEIDSHDRVNGAIKNRVIEMFADEQVAEGAKIKGTMLYKMTVDERLAPHDLVTGLDWWHDAFHTAAKAAKYLSFRFRIEFNGRTLIFDRGAKNWTFVDSVNAQ